MVVAVVKQAPPFRELTKTKGGDDKLSLNLHAGQARADDSTARFIVVLAGTQGGKTCYAPHWLDKEIIRTYNPDDEWNDYLAVTATYPLLQNKLLPEIIYVFDTLLNKGKYNKADKIFYFHGSNIRIIFGSAVNPESLEAATAKAALLDECGQISFRRNAYEAVIRRLAVSQGRILFTTTLYTLGWLKTDVYDRRLEDDDIEIIQFPSTANPRFPQAEFDRMKKNMPTWKFKMFYEGKYDRPAGMIYDSFNEELCRVDRFPIPDSWPRFVAHDFGTANTAAIWYAQNPTTGHFHAYQEYLEGGRSVGEHVAAWKKMSKLSNGENAPIIKRVGGSHQEEGWREAFSAHGWFIQEPTIHDVGVGILRVYEMHSLNKLTYMSDMKHTLDQKLSYSYRLDDNYMSTDLIDQKSSFHMMDAERYLISTFRPELAVHVSEPFESRF